MSDDRDLWDRRQRAMQRHWANMERIAARQRDAAPTPTSVDVHREHLSTGKPRIRVPAPSRKV